MKNRVYEYLKLIGLHDRRAAFVLKHGMPFNGANLPKKYRHGSIGACYRNSALMSLRHDLIYVEGFGSINSHHSPTLHAWCIDTEGHVLDRTWSFTGENSYYGIPISKSYIKTMYRRAGHYGVIDMWEFEWPIYEEEPACFLSNWCENG